MRGIVMNDRSRYAGANCMHCHQRIAKGRAAVASTYYVSPAQPYYISAYSRKHATAKLIGLTAIWNNDPVDKELELRIVYHRACIEKILRNAPEDPIPAASRFQRYRDGLVRRYVDGEV